MTSPGLEVSNVPWEAVELDRTLREGEPTLGWRGDPRLSLEIGVVRAGESGYSAKVRRVVRADEVVGMQLVVVRHCEDGTDQAIVRKAVDKIHEIIPSLCQQDPRTPAFEPIMDTVTREDDATRKVKDTAYREAKGEMTEHLWKLVADRQNGKTTFRGLPGLNPDKQM